MRILNNEAPITTLTIDFVNNCILTGSSDALIRIFELDRRDVFASHILRGHSDEIRGIVHLKERNQYVSVAWDNMIRIWRDVQKSGNFYWQFMLLANNFFRISRGTETTSSKSESYSERSTNQSSRSRTSKNCPSLNQRKKLSMIRAPWLKSNSNSLLKSLKTRLHRWRKHCCHRYNF